MPVCRAARKRTPRNSLAGAQATVPRQSIATHGGFGYAKEYHVERLYREVAITRLAPITEQLVMSFIAERVLDLPKSY